VGVVGHLKKIKKKNKKYPTKGVDGYNKSNKKIYPTRGVVGYNKSKKKGISQRGLWDVRES